MEHIFRQMDFIVRYSVFLVRYKYTMKSKYYRLFTFFDVVIRYLTFFVAFYLKILLLKALYIIVQNKNTNMLNH